jgi:hypothetical protein
MGEALQTALLLVDQTRRRDDELESALIED